MLILLDMKVERFTSIEDVAGYLSKVISSRLSRDEKVLWLIPGGSSIEVAVAAAKQLSSTELNNLTISLSDERYGPPGHPDSNWQLLKEAGFKLPGAKLVSVLQGVSLDKTTRTYDKFLKTALYEANYSIGFLGIGPDGHTAGILPGSVGISSQNYAVSYEGYDFKRITMTARAISELDEVVCYAVGEAKRPTLIKLKEELNPAEQPAQILKRVPKLTIVTDQQIS